MRIQETDQILKESKYARKGAAPAHRGFFARLWHSLTGLFR
jgi:hypothetical protein